MLSTKVSVILPAHELNLYLTQAIDSIINQTYENYELIISFDGSKKDELEKLRQKYTDKKIRIIDSIIPNLTFALNYAIDQSDGEIIVRMDSDDIAEKNRLEVIVNNFTDDCDLDIFGSAYTVINEYGEVTKSPVEKKIDDKKIRKILPFRCYIAHPTVAFKKSTFLTSGGYMYGKYSEDYELWLRMIRNKNIKFLISDEPLLKYRKHSSQLTGSQNNRSIFAHDLGIKVRELAITKRPIYIIAILFTIVDYYYKLSRYIFKHK